MNTLWHVQLGPPRIMLSSQQQVLLGKIMLFPSAPSGYYITATNDSLDSASLHCNMEGTNYGRERERGYMQQSDTTCPQGLTADILGTILQQKWWQLSEHKVLQMLGSQHGKD